MPLLHIPYAKQTLQVYIYTPYQIKVFCTNTNIKRRVTKISKRVNYSYKVIILETKLLVAIQLSWPKGPEKISQKEKWNIFCCQQHSCPKLYYCGFTYLNVWAHYDIIFYCFPFSTLASVQQSFFLPQYRRNNKFKWSLKQSVVKTKTVVATNIFNLVYPIQGRHMPLRRTRRWVKLQFNGSVKLGPINFYLVVIKSVYHSPNWLLP